MGGDDKMKNFESGLLALKEKIYGTNNQINSINGRMNDLNPSVDQFQELKSKKKELSKSVKNDEKLLGSLTNFYKSTTGEDTYSMYSLFNQSNGNSGIGTLPDGASFSGQAIS